MLKIKTTKAKFKWQEQQQCYSEDRHGVLKWGEDLSDNRKMTRSTFSWQLGTHLEKVCKLANILVKKSLQITKENHTLSTKFSKCKTNFWKIPVFGHDFKPMDLGQLWEIFSLVLAQCAWWGMSCHSPCWHLILWPPNAQMRRGQFLLVMSF